MKRFCILLFCLLFAGMAAASAAGDPIVDDANLFNPVQEAKLTAMIEVFREKTGMDFAIFTSDAPHSDDMEEVADLFYEQGGYGMDEENSGILYYIDMYQRIPYLCTTGAMIDYMTDARIEAAHESVYDNLADGNYAGAAEGMIEAVSTYVQKGIPEGRYQYDVITGQRLTARHKALTSSEMLVCALIGLVVALLYTKSVQGQYTLKGSTYDYDYADNAAVDMVKSDDDYLRTTTTRTRKETQSSGGYSGGSHSGGSGVHRSSSGTRHGGGAGRSF